MVVFRYLLKMADEYESFRAEMKKQLEAKKKTAMEGRMGGY
jgi:hypothetical protein